MTYAMAIDLELLPLGHRIVNKVGDVYEKIEKDIWRPRENDHGLFWHKNSLSLVLANDWEDAS